MKDSHLKREGSLISSRDRDAKILSVLKVEIQLNASIYNGLLDHIRCIGVVPLILLGGCIILKMLGDL